MDRKLKKIKQIKSKREAKSIFIYLFYLIFRFINQVEDRKEGAKESENNNNKKQFGKKINRNLFFFCIFLSVFDLQFICFLCFLFYFGLLIRNMLFYI